MNLKLKVKILETSFKLVSGRDGCNIAYLTNKKGEVAKQCGCTSAEVQEILSDLADQEKKI